MAYRLSRFLARNNRKAKKDDDLCHCPICERRRKRQEKKRLKAKGYMTDTCYDTSCRHNVSETCSKQKKIISTTACCLSWEKKVTKQ